MPLLHNTLKLLLFSILLLMPPTATAAKTLRPDENPSDAISSRNSSPEKFSRGKITSGEVSQPYGGPMSIAQATAQVQTQAQLQAHTKLLRKLAKEPIIQHINTVTSTFSPPDVNGLIYYLFDFTFTYQVDPTAKTIVGTVKPTPQFTDLRQAVLLSLQKRTLMERYDAIHGAQQTSLYALKQSLEEAVNPNSQTLAVKPPSIAPHKNTKKNHASPPISPESSASFRSSGLSGSSGMAASTDDYLGTSPQPPLPQPQLPLVNSPAHHANTLLALLNYQKMLRNHDGQWENPQALYAQLTEIEALSPGNPLVQGALAETLLQLKRPQQAQHHSDRAVATAKNHAYLYDIRGEIFLQLQLPTLATEAFSRAIELDRHNPVFFLHRATSYLPRNKTNAMCQDFRHACLLGDCSGYQWAFEQNLCQHDDSASLYNSAMTTPNVSPAPSSGNTVSGNSSFDKTGSSDGQKDQTLNGNKGKAEESELGSENGP